MSPPPGFWHNHGTPCGVDGCKGMPALDLQQAAQNIRASLTRSLVLEEPIEYVSQAEYLIRLREELEKS